jgi:hypothetical protein
VILATGSGAGVGVWVALWIATIVIGLIIYSASPARPGMDQKTMAARRMILISSFLPCFGINLIWVLMGWGRYKFGTRGMGKQGELDQRFKGASFDKPAPSSSPPRPAATGNPFASGGDAEQGEPPRQSGPSPDNPFA